MRRQFRDTVLRLAENDDRIVLLFGDVSVYLFQEFQNRFPERFFNLGICENTLISAGAGLAHEGFVPFVHSIAPFVTERCFEHIKMDLCYNGHGVNIVSCGSSFDYAWDGPSHQCLTDLAILRLLPGIEVLQPGSRKELDVLMSTQYANGRPTYFRLSDNPHEVDLPEVRFGRAVVLRNAGSRVAVVTAGPLLGNVVEGCRDLPVDIVYFHTLKPIDREALAAFRDRHLLVVQDAFGLLEAIHEVPGISASYHGIPDRFLDCYGYVPEIREALGLDAAGIRRAATAALGAGR